MEAHKNSPMVTIYHNTRCSKSREACSILNDKGVKTHIVEYLKEPLTQNQLKELLKKLNMNAEELVRKNEELYKNEFKNKKLSEAEWIKVLAENPVLIERPIIVNGDKAVVARPPEKVLGVI
jgi:arsenate reductase